LCGISAREKNLEVDHIVPRSLGGANDITNYQALCFTCNAQKNNTDQTDFRGGHEKYATRIEGCLFCEAQKSKLRLLEENTLAFAIHDQFAVTSGHTLIIPKRHCANYFDLTQPEINAVSTLLSSQRALLGSGDRSIGGYNIGMNCGVDAGQTVMHCHIHLIPRRKGDVAKPRGGVRNVFPGKGDY
jgi:diadenosine tetraphosphate (Ap4A) HIT family hydrolase